MENFKIEKDWMSNKLRCVVLMTPLGYRCGYVGVDKNSNFYKIDYNDSPKFLQNKLEELKNSEADVSKKGIFNLFCWNGESVSPAMLFDVHGGITYSDGGKKSKYPVESDLWWFGYDCAHLGDAKDLSIVSEDVKNIELRFDTGGTIRSLEYCIQECENLAKQISEIS